MVGPRKVDASQSKDQQCQQRTGRSAVIALPVIDAGRSRARPRLQSAVEARARGISFVQRYARSATRDERFRSVERVQKRRGVFTQADSITAAFGS